MSEQTNIEKATNATLSKKEALLIALEKNLGNISLATKAIGLDRCTFYRWCETDPDFKAKADAVKEVALDFAESALFKQIQDGDTTATIFYLKTQGKNRGYIERQEVDTHISMPSFNVLRK